jgi:CheY-like chemotaxis protein
MSESNESTEGQPQDTVILLAEDETLVRNLIELMLVKQGYTVLAVSDGHESLEILEKFTEPIQLVLTDVQMPRVDGWALAELVRKQRAETKVIVISGETATTIATDNPADAFLRKPLSRRRSCSASNASSAPASGVFATRSRDRGELNIGGRIILSANADEDGVADAISIPAMLELAGVDYGYCSEPLTLASSSGNGEALACFERAKVKGRGALMDPVRRRASPL